MLVVAAIGASVTLVYLIGLTLYLLHSGRALSSDVRHLNYLIVSLGLAVSSGFLGSDVHVRGNVPWLPGGPIAFGAAGGFAVFVVAFVLLHSFMPDAPPPPDYVIDTFQDRVDFTKWTPDADGTTGVVVTRRVALEITQRDGATADYRDEHATSGERLDCRVLEPSSATCVEVPVASGTARVTKAIVVPAGAFGHDGSLDVEYEIGYVGSFHDPSRDSWVGKDFLHPVKSYDVELDFPPTRPWRDMQVIEVLGGDTARRVILTTHNDAGALAFAWHANDVAAGTSLMLDFSF
jgi:hypothetical protein